MRIFICGSANKDLKKQYKEGINELAQGLLKRKHSIMHVGSKVGAIGEIYKAYSKNNGIIDIVVPDCYKDEAEKMDCRSVINVPNLFMLQQIALKNTDATIVLPGGNGTLAELYMLTDNIKAGFDTDPIILFNINGFYDFVIKNNEFLMTTGALKQFQKDNLIVCNTYTEVLAQLDKFNKK